MSRPVHPKKEVEAAIKHAESNGWRVVHGGAHAWGKLYCPYDDDECRCGEFCIAGIWSTPRNAQNHANALRRVVDHCSTRARGKHSAQPMPNKE
jgi:hypothetical protein